MLLAWAGSVYSAASSSLPVIFAPAAVSWLADAVLHAGRGSGQGDDEHRLVRQGAGDQLAPKVVANCPAVSTSPCSVFTCVGQLACGRS